MTATTHNQQTRDLWWMYYERGQATDTRSRFWLFINDDEIYEREEEVANSDHAAVFYDALIALYRQWLGNMTDAERADVFAYNDSLNGANQNGLLLDIAEEWQS